MVAVLAHALAVIRREVYGGEIDPGQAAVLALYHDAPEILTGDLPSPVNPPPGCAFHTRCPHANERCRQQTPPLCEVEAGHFVACHLYSGEDSPKIKQKTEESV